MLKIPRSSDELRLLLFGIIAGVAIVIGSLALVSEVAGVKWQPVKIWRSYTSQPHPQAIDLIDLTAI